VSDFKEFAKAIEPSLISLELKFEYRNRNRKIIKIIKEIKKKFEEIIF
jgi:hypothetical protein